MKKKLLSYLERFITEERKERFLEIIAQRTNHFTVAMEDVFQMHNTSAVVRTCEVFGAVSYTHLTLPTKYLACSKHIALKVALANALMPK